MTVDPFSPIGGGLKDKGAQKYANIVSLSKKEYQKVFTEY